MTTFTERMRDAAFPENIPGNWAGAVGGYFGGPRAFNVWSPGNWRRFSHLRKLPIWVSGLNGLNDGKAAVVELRHLGVPQNTFVVADMETRVDKTYCQHFGNVMDDAGYKMLVYGSASTVFGNPSPHGYWVADYAGKGPFMYDGPPGADVRMTQYVAGQNYDSSTVKDYTYNQAEWWI